MSIAAHPTVPKIPAREPVPVRRPSRDEALDAVKTLIRWAGRIGPQTLEQIHERVVLWARQLKVTRGRKLRTDGTVVATTIHHPTDSSLLADGVRVLSRLVGRAKQLDMAPQVFDALQRIVEKLETVPLEWGDPEYSTKQAGGLVLHGLQFPFIVQYVTFQQQRVVCILKIRVFPGHPLGTD